MSATDSHATTDRHTERRHRSHLAGPRCLRRAGTADAGPDRASHRPAPLVRASDARAPGPAALAAPQRPRLRTRHASGGVGFTRRAPGPPGARRQPLLGELHRATGLVVHLAVLDGPDVVYLEKIGDRSAPRSPPGSAAVSPPIAQPSERRSWLTATTTLKWICRPAGPSTRSRPARNWLPNWPRYAPTASPSSARNHYSGSVVWRRPSGAPARPLPPCRCAVR